MGLEELLDIYGETMYDHMNWLERIIMRSDFLRKIGLGRFVLKRYSFTIEAADNPGKVKVCFYENDNIYFSTEVLYDLTLDFWLEM